jgi:hypothetical protein
MGNDGESLRRHAMRERAKARRQGQQKRAEMQGSTMHETVLLVDHLASKAAEKEALPSGVARCRQQVLILADRCRAAATLC